MALLELPHTPGCLVCGCDNPHGLHLSSRVDPDTGLVHMTFTPSTHHIGFENIIHGGILATVLDELMVWAAIWASGRACVAAELSLRFLHKAGVNHPLEAIAKITRQRSRLIETSAELHDAGKLICTASAKYIPLDAEQTTAFLQTFVEDPATAQTAARLRSNAKTIPPG